MLYLPITRSWIISRTSRRVYLACAISAIVLLCMRIVVIAVSQFSGFAEINSTVLKTLVPPLVITGWISIAVLWTAMWYFWFSFHTASAGTKFFWFIVLFLPPLGTLGYFFGAYYRSTYFHRSPSVVTQANLIQTETEPLAKTTDVISNQL